MDVSVQGYLSRRTEDELGSMLRYYIVREDWKDYVRELRMIIRELHKRSNGDMREAGEKQ